jgi:uncharacterized protein YmfQ (DUF2313 family)
MARSTDEVLDELLAIAPPGALSPDRDGYWATHLLPLADALSTAEQRYDGMFPQVDPRNATDFLADFERVLGPDPLGRDQTALTLAARQQLAFQRWTFNGGCSLNFYVGLAASLGVGISIQTFQDSRCGDAECGDILAPEADALTWQITMPASLVNEAICGVSVCGDCLGSFSADPLPALIGLYAQPHTLPVFILSSELDP